METRAGRNKNRAPGYKLLKRLATHFIIHYPRSRGFPLPLCLPGGQAPGFCLCKGFVNQTGAEVTINDPFFSQSRELGRQSQKQSENGSWEGGQQMTRELLFSECVNITQTIMFQFSAHENGLRLSRRSFRYTNTNRVLLESVGATGIEIISLK